MFTEQLIKDIHFQYAQTRQRNERELEERMNALYRRLPRLRAIEEELSQLGIEVAQAVLKSPEHLEAVQETYHAASRQLISERAYLLTENDIPLEALQLRVDCPKCRDTGYIEDNQRCTCFTQKLADHLYEMSNIRTRMDKENLRTFQMELFSTQPEEGGKSQKDNVAQILSAVEQYIYQFNPASSPNLYFYGPTGQGKTFLCSTIAKGLIDKGHVVVYQTAFKLIEILENYHFGEKNQLAREKYRLLFDSELLILDDLGTEFNNSFTNTEIFNLINGRLLANRPTLISTNLSLKDVEKVYGTRVASRIFGEYDIYKFFGPDLRWRS